MQKEVELKLTSKINKQTSNQTKKKTYGHSGRLTQNEKVGK